MRKRLLIIVLIIVLIVILTVSICTCIKSNFSNDNSLPIGILICCYNRPDYVKKTLDSLSQSIINNTIICIIDDKSTDKKVRNLIENFKHPFGNEIIRVYNKKNVGIAININKGYNILFQKNCLYICNLDSDVIMKPNWLIKLKEAHVTAQLQNPNDNIIISGFNCNNSCSHKIYKTINNIHYKKSIGGVNLFFNNKTYQNIFKNVFKSSMPHGWDWAIVSKCNNSNCKLITTNPSVIQHIGQTGKNSSSKKFDFAEDY